MIYKNQPMVFDEGKSETIGFVFFYRISMASPKE